MPQPDRIVELAQGEHAQAIEQLEDRAKQRAVSQLAAQLDAVESAATALWVALFGDLAVEGEGVALRRLLDGLRARLRAAYSRAGLLAPVELDAALQAALGLGVAQAQRLAGVTAAAEAVVDADTLAAIEGVPGILAEQLALAERQLAILGTAGGSFPSLLAALSQARKGQTRVEASAAWVVERGVSTGSGAVAEEIGAHKLWIAERNACLTCLAYAGEVVQQTFPAGRTFGRKSTVHKAIPGPPAHPHCRCTITPWTPDDVDRSGVTGVEYGAGRRERAARVDLPAALKREARRSVVKGWSDHDSTKQRLAAAERLLVRGARLPKSVEQTAHNAVRRGTFAR